MIVEESQPLSTKPSADAGVDSATIEAAVELIRGAVEAWSPAAVYALFSGGHDSATSTALAARAGMTAAVHIHTGIGIPETREYVHETARAQGWPLIEVRSEAQYEQLVLERGGFPSGPRSHSSMYWHLKQRPLDALIRQAKRRRGDHVVLVTGIRTSESVRRMGSGISVPMRRDDHCRVWVNPILEWSALDCSRYMADAGVARSPVVDLLHRSGECLCGALARADELIELERWFPAPAQRIHELEAQARAAGLKHTRWADRRAWADAVPLTLPLCASCELSTGNAPAGG